MPQHEKVNNYTMSKKIMNAVPETEGICGQARDVAGDDSNGLS